MRWTRRWPAEGHADLLAVRPGRASRPDQGVLPRHVLRDRPAAPDQAARPPQGEDPAPARLGPLAEPTGISYLDLLGAQRTRADGAAYSIRYHYLACDAGTEGDPS